MSYSNKGLPRTNIRYRATKSPDQKSKNTKNNNEMALKKILQKYHQLLMIFLN